jgi:enoyl-CoA hydratase/carnithine racemase
MAWHGGVALSEPDSGYVRVARREGVAIVTLNHPADRNSLSLTMTRELARAVHQASSDEAIRALVLTATGTVFSAGGSVDDLLEPRAPLDEMYAGFVAVMESGLPTVAAVNGPALGAGMNLALACDVIVCSPSARFETRFLHVGLHPGGGHLWQLRGRIGRQGAAALSLFGETLDGEEAARRHLAWRCVPESELLDVAWQLAARAAEHDPALMALVRETLDDSVACERASDAIALELQRQQWSMGRPEFVEALGRLRARLGRDRETDQP